MTPLILIADDEADIVQTLDYNLRREGFETRVAYTGQEAIAQATLEPTPDLVLLDLMLPDMSGTEVCRRLRANASTREMSVVMITAKGEEIDRVVGFEVGADDYVVKPFSVRELMLRVRAILRRRQQSTEVSAPADKTSGRDVITHSGLSLDLDGHVVSYIGQPIKLTVLEFKLLKTLLTRRGRVQSRERLLSDVWGYAPDVTTRTVDTHIKRLRAKLGAAGEYVETVRGVGYCVRPETE